MFVHYLIRIYRRRTRIALACALATATAISPGLARAKLPGGVFAAVQLSGKLNLNTATQAQLELLPGVGPAMAERVIAYRSQHLFSSPAQIRRVKGIGKKTYQKLQPYLAVEGETTLTRAK